MAALTRSPRAPVLPGDELAQACNTAAVGPPVVPGDPSRRNTAHRGRYVLFIAIHQQGSRPPRAKTCATGILSVGGELTRLVGFLHCPYERAAIGQYERWQT